MKNNSFLLNILFNLFVYFCEKLGLWIVYIAYIGVKVAKEQNISDVTHRSGALLNSVNKGI